MHLSKHGRCPDCGCPMFPSTDHACPPIVRGGQGRSDDSVRADATDWWLFTILALACIATGLCFT